MTNGPAQSAQAIPPNRPAARINSADGLPEPGGFAEFRALADAAEETDGHPPFSEQTLVRLRQQPTADQVRPRLLLGFVPDEPQSVPVETPGPLAGVAVLLADADGVGATLELTVHPVFRNQGIGTALLEQLREERGFAGLRAWSHGNHAAAERLAGRFGFQPVRELLRLRLATGAATDQAPVWPDGVRLRSFVPGQDEQAWLAVNAAAFAHHPEQGAMTLGDLQARMTEDWFDPDGFLLAVDDADQVLGFHWTKIHAGANGHADLGEVYVVGIAPQAQGTGLGKALTLAGIDYLHRRGLAAIMLYVDADNTAAVALYRKLGFSPWDADVMYGLPDAAAGATVE
ncbi:MAG: mycothiol synthase [Renibacterium sp.]|nr:mycothiol synthase [Renibacterium sp.]